MWFDKLYDVGRFRGLQAWQENRIKNTHWQSSIGYVRTFAETMALLDADWKQDA